MKDIDFDELDKAVSSALAQNSTPAVEPAVSEPVSPAPRAQSTPVEPAGLPDEEPVKVSIKSSDPVIDPPRQEPEKPDNTPSQPPRIITPSRRAGRFMDMVHPSSDMAGPKAAVAPTQRVKMSGRTIEPLGAVPAPSTAEDKVEDVEEPKQAAVEPAEEVPVAVSPVPAPEEPAASDDPVPAEQPPAFVPEEPVMPAFVDDANARVEKRPLGAFSESPAAEPTEPSIPQGDELTPNAGIPSNPPDQKYSDDKLPRELNSDIVSVESDNATMPAYLADQKEAPSVATISGNLSIPKQYQETERPMATDAHSLFDTEEYHPPLNVPADPGHRFVWVWVSVAVLLLVGAGALFAYWYIGGM